MSNEINTAHVTGLLGVAVTIYDLDGVAIPGYASPNIQSIKVSPRADVVDIKNQDGDESGALFSNQQITMDLDWIPEGTTKAAAKISATSPPPGARVKISGAPVIRKGWLSDAINGDADYPWVFYGNSDDNLKNDSHSMMTLSITRKIGMPTYSKIS